MAKPKYKRVMLKLSGEILMGEYEFGIDYKVLKSYLDQLIEVSDLGVEMLVEVGGGNIYRWKTAQSGVRRDVADGMGMMGSIMNAMNFESLEPSKVKAMSTVAINKFIDSYTVRKAKEYLEKKYVVIIGGGVGNQFFTTDTGAVTHALQTECDVVLKGTNVDGVFDKDPMKYKDAKKYTEVSYDEVLSKNLNVMDMSAFALSRENNMPVIVFNTLIKGNIKKAVLGEKVGTNVN